MKFSVVFTYFAGFSLMICAIAAGEGYPFDSGAREPMAELIDPNGNVLIAKKVGLGGLNLKGIIYSATVPLAVINDEVLSEGDTVAGYVIVAITEKGVRLDKDNKGFTLTLEEE
jgi:hypothetical protein